MRKTPSVMHGILISTANILIIPKRAPWIRYLCVIKPPCMMIFPLFLTHLLLTGVQCLPQVKRDVAATAKLAEGLSTEEMNDAWPSRDMADIQNWYGTSLFGWK